MVGPSQLQRALQAPGFSVPPPSRTSRAVLSQHHRRTSRKSHVTMLFILATSLATLELTPDNWEKEVANSGKSAMIK